LRRRLRELAAERRRFDYRRLLILLRQDGFMVHQQPPVLTVGKRGGASARSTPARP
jgi:hypothetical protein